VSNNVAYRGWVFRTVGGFDEGFPLAAGEDMEIGSRIVARGWRQYRHPAALVSHHHDLSPWGHVARQFRYGRGGLRFHTLQHRLIDSGRLRPMHTTGFYERLFAAARRDRLPVQQILILAAGQIAYRCGVLFARVTLPST
jgi:GT2 family glycosyltransferase